MRWPTRVRETATEWFERAEATPLGRSIVRYQHFRGNRLAGAVTFYGYLSVFPLLVVGFAVTLRVLGADAVAQFEDTVEEYIPGISQELALPEVRQQATTVGAVGLIALVVTGLGWVDAQRASVRAMWGLPDRDDNVVLRKIKDLAALIGLGALIVLSFLATSWATGVASQVLDWLQVERSTAAQTGLHWFGIVLSGLTSVVLMGYLIAGLPRIRMRRKVWLTGALVGGLAFELSKHLLVGYLSGIASRSTYGAFGVPIALAVWIYVMARLIMAVAAWSAEVSGASMVQPRFAEAAVAEANHAAAAAQDEAQTSQAVAPAAETGPAGKDPLGHATRKARWQGVALGALTALALSRLLRRR